MHLWVVTMNMGLDFTHDVLLDAAILFHFYHVCERF